MATLTGKIIDVTSRPPDSISSITVKAPSVRIGSGTDVIVSSPAEVTFDKTTGDITISGLTGGLSWLYIEGDGWSDSIPLAVAEGMITIVEAIANAAGVPGLVDYIELLVGLQARIDDIAQDAVDGAAENIRWFKGSIDNTHSTMADIPIGLWGISTQGHAERLGLPSDFGSLQVMQIGASKSAFFLGQTTGFWTATEQGGAWGEWKKLATHDEVSAKADKTYVDDEVDAAKWYRGGLGSSDSLDDYRGLDSQGMYRVTPSVGGGTGLSGWVEVTYDSNSARTRQVFTSASPANAVSLERKYSGGVWRDWSPVTWHGVVVSSGSADDLIDPHVYAINVTGIGGVPEPLLGSLETLPAGSGVSTLTQIFTSSESTPRTWKRTRRSSVWNEWVQMATGQDVEEIVARQLGDLGISDTPITFSPTETATTGGSVIVQSLSIDRRVGYNALTPTLRQTFDEGENWENIYSFSGTNIEWVRALPNGELMVETTTGSSGFGRRVWVSEGYTPSDPTSATWTQTLNTAAPYVKIADWSISITDEMILLAEYGPKSGVSWGSVDSIPEGENARYIYRSYDNGKTWDTIFDLNTFLLAGGRSSADGQHLHGVAWDHYWDRIWVTFGDATGNGSNGVLYSDDEGQSWHAAYWTHLHPSQGWQVVGIQPMKDCVLFAGDMTPSGVIRLDRAQGKHPSNFEFETGWDYSDTEKHLCQQIVHFDNGRSESAFFAFSREGTTSPSFIVATKNGWDWDLLWASSDNPLPGIRTIAGPTKNGNLIAAVNSSSGWSRVSGRIDAY